MSAVLNFDEPSHTYTLAGRRLPSVTQVLQLLEDWDKVPFDVLEAARIFGQHVHQACALMVRGILDWRALDPQLVPYVEGARNFLKDSGLIVLASEVRMAHPTLGFAGTGDVFGPWDGELSCVDFKSGQFMRTTGPQTAAYGELYHRCYGVRVKRRYGVQLHPDFARGYKIHKLTNTADWHIFVSCLNVHRFRNPGVQHAA